MRHAAGRPPDRPRDPSRVRHRALGVLPAVPLLGGRQGGVGASLAGLVRRPESRRGRPRPAPAYPRAGALPRLPPGGSGPRLDGLRAARRAQPAAVRAEEAEGVRSEDRPAAARPALVGGDPQGRHRGGQAKRLRDVPPDSVDKDAIALTEALTELRWRQVGGTGEGFGDVHPRYVFRLLSPGAPGASCSPASTSSGDATSRRPTRPASRSRWAGARRPRGFHELYVRPAERGGFTPRGLTYFQRMWKVMSSNRFPKGSSSISPGSNGEALAATTAVRVGSHVWYSYGASADHLREVPPQQRRSSGA